MELSDYLTAITRESAALADAAERAGLDAPVPSCPGWDVGDLVAHVGEVQQWARITVEQRATERISRRTLPGAPGGPERVPWFRGQAASLVAVLAATPVDARVWSWTDDDTAQFWSRRQANEAAVHRWDAELAAGAPATIDAALAADGVDERLGWLPARADLAGAGETVHLHCTDTNGEWFVTLSPSGSTVERVHAKGDVAARGAASDLDLFVWGRVAPTDLDVFGDAALLARFQELISF
ncbi:MAG TPA: maleylpyruvate isomerase family mycothiol-dependent enzyme [Acidimicrobiia bacterium]|nr:maleylpyruvate isomerase family mycothiol-dependent enzyme [Acidimicrobiia bacterium]